VLLGHTGYDPDCVGCAVQGGCRSVEVRFDVLDVLNAEADVGLDDESDDVAVVGSTVVEVYRPQTDEIVSSAVPTR